MPESIRLAVLVHSLVGSTAANLQLYAVPEKRKSTGVLLHLTKNKYIIIVPLN